MKKIGSLKLENPYFLAPMAGINDIAFRILCKNAGAGLVYTGMINPLTREELAFDDKPAIQLFAANERGIAKFINKHEMDAVLFDFNLGCPADVAKRQGFGSFMHNNLQKIERILEVMRNSTEKPITIKLRKSNKAEKIIKLAEKYCDAIAIHARTSKQGYSGEADIKFAENIKKKTNLPVIYSGDVDENNAEELLKTFDFVMIGRKAIGHPNVFAKLIGRKEIYGFDDYLKLSKKYKLKFKHIRAQSIMFTKGMEGASRIRERLSRAKSINEIVRIIS